MAPPGGTMQCVNYDQVKSVPDPTSCFANPFAVSDPTGASAFDSRDATIAGSTADVLSGLIGNVAQVNTGARPDWLRVHEEGGRVLLEQSHNTSPPPPVKPGPLTGESFTHGCAGWSAPYAVRDRFTGDDVELVPAADAPNVRCFITGVAGAWSSTRSDGAQQPYAEIYKGAGGEMRLRVWPPGREDPGRAGAYASCIRTN